MFTLLPIAIIQKEGCKIFSSGNKTIDEKIKDYASSTPHANVGSIEGFDKDFNLVKFDEEEISFISMQTNPDVRFVIYLLPVSPEDVDDGGDEVMTQKDAQLEGRWITISGGRRIFIKPKKGETLGDAIDRKAERQELKRNVVIAAGGLATGYLALTGTVYTLVLESLKQDVTRTLGTKAGLPVHKGLPLIQKAKMVQMIAIARPLLAAGVVATTAAYFHKSYKRLEKAAEKRGKRD